MSSSRVSMWAPSELAVSSDLHWKPQKRGLISSACTQGRYLSIMKRWFKTYCWAWLESLWGSAKTSWGSFIHGIYICDRLLKKKEKHWTESKDARSLWHRENPQTEFVKSLKTGSKPCLTDTYNIYPPERWLELRSGKGYKADRICPFKGEAML